jgi:hypothetical protein
MKIRIWHIAVFVVALVVFAVARAPAAFFLPQRPGQLSYAGAEGTIWGATLNTVALGPYRIQAASWRLSPLDVIQGKAIIPVSVRGGDMDGDLVLLGNWHGDRRIGVSQLRVAGLPIAQAMLPGETRFHGVDILFEDGACVHARGRVESDVLVRAGQALGWAGPPMAGNASCEGKDARIALTGANEAGERVNANILLKGDGAASWRVSVLTRREQTLAALAGAGFTPSAADGTLGYGEETRWLP